MEVLSSLVHPPTLHLLTLPGLILGLVYYLSRRRATASHYQLPPSPPGEPILGHLRSLPFENAHLKHMEYAKQYDSDVIYFNILGHHIVVLNSLEAANDLLDKKGADYQDRPHFVLFDVMGWDLTLTFMPYGPRFRLHRSVFRAHFSKTAVVKYQSIQENEARQAVARILLTPNKWEHSLSRFATAVMLSIGFGVRVQSDDDPYIQIAREASIAAGQGGDPGASLVDYFPLFRFAPAWLNLSRTLRHARSSRQVIERLHQAPFAAIRKEFNEGTANPSFAYSLLHERSENERQGRPNRLSIADIQGASGAAFIAGSDTTFSTLTVSILNLMRNPAVLWKARDDIDRVVGTGRLPGLSDRPALKYIDYIVEEATRWRPLSPIGIPHQSLKDGVYKGMFIPKGTQVFYNSYAMSRDTKIYRDPEAFDPDRYAPAEVGGNAEPYLVGAFGFGRRICPGRHLAQASVWIMLATLIATLDLESPRDADDKIIEQDPRFSTGLASHLESFDAVFSPRSQRYADMLLTAAAT